VWSAAVKVFPMDVRKSERIIVIAMILLRSRKPRLRAVGFRRPFSVLIARRPTFPNAQNYADIASQTIGGCSFAFASEDVLAGNQP